MAIFSVKASPVEREWLERYEESTTFEPMQQTEFDQGKISFARLVSLNNKWFEDWMYETYHTISTNIP